MPAICTDSKHRITYPKAMSKSIIGLRRKGTGCSCCADQGSHLVTIANTSDPDKNEKMVTCQRHADMAFQDLTSFFKHYHGRQENLKYERSLNDSNQHAVYANAST